MRNWSRNRAESLPRRSSSMTRSAAQGALHGRVHVTRTLMQLLVVRKPRTVGTLALSCSASSHTIALLDPDRRTISRFLSSRQSLDSIEPCGSDDQSHLQDLVAPFTGIDRSFLLNHKLYHTKLSNRLRPSHCLYWHRQL